jgi:FMN reductase
MNHERLPIIVGIGGTFRPGSTSEQALAIALKEAGTLGAKTKLFGGSYLRELPHYGCGSSEKSEELVATLKDADGVIVSTPAYHGNVSGLVKNALDFMEELRDEKRAYLAERPVGIIVTCAGWQGGGAALIAMRSTIHSLRGWPTPYGAVLNSTSVLFDAVGKCWSSQTEEQLALVGTEVTRFATRSHQHRMMQA